jgi:endonuclease/exonuclease/phosphatase family metal-dependent hydrolase
MRTRCWMRVAAGVVCLLGNVVAAHAQPFGGTPWPVPGTVQAEDFDDGEEGSSYYDSTPGNDGWQYRSSNVDVEFNGESGYNVGWTDAGEYLNYSVDVASSGNYLVQLRVASEWGGSIHVGFNGASPVWSAVPVAGTGGWQEWSTITVPVTLGAGRQLMTLVMDTGGVNVDEAAISFSGAEAPSVPQIAAGRDVPTGGYVRMMTWNIQHGRTAYGAYDLTSQAWYIASERPDVVALQEVETWDEYQPERYRSLLEQFTGESWTVVWAPVNNSGSTEGNVILTRLPVVAANAYQLHASGDWSALYSNRSVAQATVRVAGIDLNVFSTHLDYYNTGDRTTQLYQLMSWATNFGGPRLVGGDFNSWWGEYWITTMQNEYTDTWQDSTGTKLDGYTVNNAVRFDYIFRSFDGGWLATPVNCYAPWTWLSDHNPVIADYRIR